jgi:hypothetical protein
MSKEAYADSLDHWAKCFRDGTLDDSFANEIAYLLEDKAADVRADSPQERLLPTITVVHAPTQEEWGLVFSDLGQLDAYDYDYIIQLGTFGKEVFC